MANSDKNIRITGNRGAGTGTNPKIVFTGAAAGSSVITLEVLDTNELRFSSNEGTVFALNSNLSSGTIWSVNDISAVPLFRASAGGTIGIGEFGTTLVGIGQTNPLYKLDVKGQVGFASTSDNLYSILIDNVSTAGSNSLQIRSANDLRFYNTGNTFYTGFQAGAATANTTYTWPLTSPASGTSVLQSDTSGTLSWVAVSASGGGAGTVASGTANQVAIYAATGASVSGAANLTYNTTSVTVANTTASINNSSGALLVYGGIGASGQISGAGASFTSTVFLNGIRIGQGGNNITFTDSAGTTIGSFNTSNGWLKSDQTTQSTTSGTGALVSAGGLGVAKAASIGETIYALSTVNSTSLTTGALVVSGGAGIAKTSYFGQSVVIQGTTASGSTTTGALTVTGGVGIGGSLNVFGTIDVSNNIEVLSQKEVRFFNSANTFYTGLKAGAPAANTTYTLPIAFPGSGTSVLASDTSGIMSWIASGGGSGTVTTLTAGNGISFSTGSTITTTGTIRAKRPLVISFCSGYTPTAAGADTVIVRIPDSPTDGTTALTYIPKEFHVRVETPSAGTSTIQLEKYTGTSAFSGTAVSSLTITGGAVYEVQGSAFAAAGLALTSNDKLRINFTALNATHANFSVSLELEEV